MNLSHRFRRTFNIHAIKPPKNFVPINNTPICLEIGAGKGKHAIMFAKANLDKNIIAIERTTHKYEAFIKSAHDLNLANLSIIHADAIFWSVFALYPKQIEQCFILYPNPEPHNKNQRFLNMPFFEFLLSRMSDNGQIIIASNIAEYIKEAEQLLKDVWYLPYKKHTIAQSSERTHFEIKYLARGEVCQELIIHKPKDYKTRFDDVQPLMVDAHE